jgi:hypothetical protein
VSAVIPKRISPKPTMEWFRLGASRTKPTARAMKKRGQVALGGLGKPAAFSERSTLAGRGCSCTEAEVNRETCVLTG